MANEFDNNFCYANVPNYINSYYQSEFFTNIFLFCKLQKQPQSTATPRDIFLPDSISCTDRIGKLHQNSIVNTK